MNARRSVFVDISLHFSSVDSYVDLCPFSYSCFSFAISSRFFSEASFCLSSGQTSISAARSSFNHSLADVILTRLFPKHTQFSCANPNYESSAFRTFFRQVFLRCAILPPNNALIVIAGLPILDFQRCTSLCWLGSELE